MTSQESQRLDGIGYLLVVRQYNRTFLPEQSRAAELTHIEFTFLAVYEFYRNLHINGFDGFIGNTSGQFTDYLPIALAAIGAPECALLVRLAWRERTLTQGRFNTRLFDTYNRENVDRLLLAYADRHQSELPDPAMATAEFFTRWEKDKKDWWSLVRSH